MRRMKTEEPTSTPATDSHESVPSPPAQPGASTTNNAVFAGHVDTVTVVWGKELFSPRQFHTFEVGPFSMTVALKPGQSRGEAMSEAYALLDLFAKEERERKRTSYMAALASTGAK